MLDSWMCWGFFSTGDESLAEIYAWEEDEIIMDSFVILLS